MAKQIECKLQTKSMAQLAEEVAEILKSNPQDGDVGALIKSQGYSPPHKINGVPIEELEAAQLEDEDS